MVLLLLFRYGYEIYKHVNHWYSLGHKLAEDFYYPGQFIKCTKQGHHACLDQFSADGSLQFNVEHIDI